MSQETHKNLSSPPDLSLTVGQARCQLGIIDIRTMGNPRNLPPLLNPYLSPDHTRLTQAEYSTLRDMLLAELEVCLLERPELAARLLGQKPFFEAYRERAKTTR